MSYGTSKTGVIVREGNTFLERAVCLAYPLGDIVAGTLALLLLVRSRGRGNGHMAMIAAAVFSLLLADLGFAYKHPTGSYGTGRCWTPTRS